MDHVAAQVSAELTTGVLNRVLHDAFARVQPPLVHGRRLKLYYGAETGTRPVRVRLFVNDPALRSAAYEAYLIGCLRRAFGLEGAPVVLDFRSSHRE
jgi:GTP-binding protein